MADNDLDTQITKRIKDKWKEHLVNQEDPLNLVIRGHLYVEGELNALLRTMVHDIVLTTLKPSFEERIKLATNLGILPERLIEPTRFLNGLRNKLAHRLDEDVTEGDVDDLFDACERGQMFSLYITTQFNKAPYIKKLRSCIAGLVLHYSTEIAIQRGEVGKRSYLATKWRAADERFAQLKEAKPKRKVKRAKP